MIGCFGDDWTDEDIALMGKPCGWVFLSVGGGLTST